MKATVAAVVLAFVLPAGALEDTKLGAGVTLKDATPIEVLVARPADFAGKTVRVDGVATAVCTSMGCWMAVASKSDPKGPVVRLKVEDGVIVFPMSAKGRDVSAEGVFEAVADEHGKRLRLERGAQPPSESEREPSARAGGGAPAHQGGSGPASTGKEAHAAQDPKASAAYQIKATGAVIR